MVIAHYTQYIQLSTSYGAEKTYRQMYKNKTDFVKKLSAQLAYVRRVC